jgi:hypothetical protein
VTPAGLLAASVVAGAVLWLLPPEPEAAPIIPETAVWEAYEYGEIPVGAAEASQTLQKASISGATPETGRCTQWSEIAALEGFSEAEIEVLEQILWHESRCETNVIGDADRGGSYGIAQIHTPSWCRPTKYYPDGYLQAYGLVLTCDDLFDPRLSIRAARAIYVYAGHSFRPWSTYKLVKGASK